MSKFCSLVKERFLALSLGVFALASSAGSLFAQDEATSLSSQVETALGSVDFAATISKISSTVLPWVISAIGIGVTFFVVKMAWNKIRSAMY